MSLLVVLLKQTQYLTNLLHAIIRHCSCDTGHTTTHVLKYLLPDKAKTDSLFILTFIQQSHPPRTSIMHIQQHKAYQLHWFKVRSVYLLAFPSFPSVLTDYTQLPVYRHLQPPVPVLHELNIRKLYFKSRYVPVQTDTIQIAGLAVYKVSNC
jgi:hypothetical protein